MLLKAAYHSSWELFETFQAAILNYNFYAFMLYHLLHAFGLLYVSGDILFFFLIFLLSFLQYLSCLLRFLLSFSLEHYTDPLSKNGPSPGLAWLKYSPLTPAQLKGTLLRSGLALALLKHSSPNVLCRSLGQSTLWKLRCSAKYTYTERRIDSTILQLIVKLIMKLHLSVNFNVALLKQQIFIN